MAEDDGIDKALDLHSELTASFGPGIAACLLEIMSKVANTTRPITQILKDCDSYPAVSEFYAYLHHNELLRKLYARARLMRCEIFVDEIQDIADTPQTGTTERVSEKGKVTITGDMLDHRKLRIETRKWLLGKMKPREFGDKNTTEHVGKDGEPLTITFKSILEQKKLP